MAAAAVAGIAATTSRPTSGADAGAAEDGGPTSQNQGGGGADAGVQKPPTGQGGYMVVDPVPPPAGCGCRQGFD